MTAKIIQLRPDTNKVIRPLAEVLTEFGKEVSPCPPPPPVSYELTLAMDDVEAMFQANWLGLAEEHQELRHSYMRLGYILERLEVRLGGRCS